ncbi:MAG: helix-turn-helix domain-containing protein [Acutalibacteraceae bacterium]|jgi:transcriptional regulator with XRE-family HTH domain
MPEMCVAIIDELIEIRKEKGLTQRELAEAANLAQPAIARLESKAVTPQLDTLLKIAAALGYDLALVQITA